MLQNGTVDIAGNLDVYGGIDIPADNQKLQLGAGQDLQLYHDGTHSRIHSVSQPLIIKTIDGYDLSLQTNSENAVVCKGNAAVELYYNNVKKVSTRSWGLEVLGNIHADDNYNLILGTSNDLNIYHDGSNSYVTNSTGDLIFQHGSENLMQLKDDGAVELYYDNAKKFETTSGGASITGGLELTGGITTGGELNLQNGTTNTARFIDCGLGDANALYIRRLSGGANHEVLAYFARGGAVGLYYDNAQKIYTQSWGAGITGDVRPSTGAIYDLGTSSYRWRNVYTNDLCLSNEGSSNDIDGSWGDWTIQEGESDLFLKNNRSGKKYKFNLTEVS